MKEETKDRICTLFTLAVIALIVAGGIAKTYPRYGQYRALKRQIAECEAKIAQTEKETNQLNENVRRFGTDREFVESVARQNRRVYPGELVFVFEDGDGGAGREAAR